MGRVDYEKISRSESWDRFDAAARRLCNVSGDTFAKRWDAGLYKRKCGDPKVIEVAMLRPSGR